MYIEEPAITSPSRPTTDTFVRWAQENLDAMRSLEIRSLQQTGWGTPPQKKQGWLRSLRASLSGIFFKNET